MNPVSNIVISRKDFKKDDELYLKVAEQIRLLLEAGYVIVAEDVEDRGGTIVIQYSPANAGKNMPRPYWLVDNECVAAMEVHMDNEIARARNVLDAAKKADDFANMFSDLTDKDKGSGGFSA